MTPKQEKSIISIEIPQFEDDVSLIEEIGAILKKYGFIPIDMRASILESSILYRYQRKTDKNGN